MDKKELLEQLDTLKKELEAAVTEKTKKEIEAQIKALEEKLGDTKAMGEKVNTITKDLETITTNLGKVIKAQDEMLAAQKEQRINGFQTPADQLGAKLTENAAALKSFREGNGKGFTINMDRKVAGIFSSAGNLTGSYLVSPTVVPGLTAPPYEEVHLRNILPVGQTNSNVVRYIQDNGGEGAPLMVAEGVAKPIMDRDLEIKDAIVRKIAVYMRVPEEMIEDIAYLQSFLTQIGTQEVMLVEDTQILYGDGNGQNLSGLSDNSTAFAGGTSAVDDPNEYDVLRAARKQARLLKRYPSVALVNPGDYYNMTSRKDSTNNYLFLGGGNGINVGVNIDGLRILDHTAVEPDEFFVVDPRATSIFDRTGLSVRFYDQDQDNAIKNLITIVIEKRLTLVVYYTTGVIYGTFSAGITDLATADS